MSSQKVGSPKVFKDIDQTTSYSVNHQFIDDLYGRAGIECDLKFQHDPDKSAELNEKVWSCSIILKNPQTDQVRKAMNLIIDEIVKIDRTPEADQTEHIKDRLNLLRICRQRCVVVLKRPAHEEGVNKTSPFLYLSGCRMWMRPQAEKVLQQVINGFHMTELGFTWNDNLRNTDYFNHTQVLDQMKKFRTYIQKGELCCLEANKKSYDILNQRTNETDSFWTLVVNSDTEQLPPCPFNAVKNFSVFGYEYWFISRAVRDEMFAVLNGLEHNLIPPTPEFSKPYINAKGQKVISADFTPEQFDYFCCSPDKPDAVAHHKRGNIYHLEFPYQEPVKVPRAVVPNMTPIPVPDDRRDYLEGLIHKANRTQKSFKKRKSKTKGKRRKSKSKKR
jgi:hypothetical protein